MIYVFEGAAPRPGVAVLLEPGEIRFAEAVARQRQEEAARMSLPDRHGYRGDGLAIHLPGACGELALALALGVPWDATVNTFKRGGDVGRLQVRTRSSHAWDLLIRDDDRPEDTFWLVTGSPPLMRVVGWIVARDGMRPEYRESHGGREEAWFVPQAALHPFSIRFPWNIYGAHKRARTPYRPDFPDAANSAARPPVARRGVAGRQGGDRQSVRAGLPPGRL